MSLSSTLTNLNNARGALVEAINSKGVTVDSSATLYSCVSAIAAIPTGSGGGIDVSSTTAEAGDVLSPKIFYDSAGNLTTGTIPTVSATVSGAVVTVPAGYIASAQNISAGTDPVGNATDGDLLAGKSATVSGGSVISGTIPTVSATSSGSQITVPSGYIGIPQTFNVSAGAEVTLGYVDSAGNFQPLSFSGTIAEDSGSAVTVSAFYGWNLPASVNVSGLVISSGTTVIVSSGEVYSGTTIYSGGIMVVSSGGTAIDNIVSGTMMVIGYAVDNVIDGGILVPVGYGSAYNTVINNNGVLKILPQSAITSQDQTTYSGPGYAFSSFVNSGGTMMIGPICSADHITVSSGGSMIKYIHSATVSNVTRMTGAIVSSGIFPLLPFQ